MKKLSHYRSGQNQSSKEINGRNIILRRETKFIQSYASIQIVRHVIRLFYSSEYRKSTNKLVVRRVNNWGEQIINVLTSSLSNPSQVLSRNHYLSFYKWSIMYIFFNARVTGLDHILKVYLMTHNVFSNRYKLSPSGHMYHNKHNNIIVFSLWMNLHPYLTKSINILKIIDIFFCKWDHSYIFDYIILIVMLVFFFLCLGLNSAIY